MTVHKSRKENKMEKVSKTKYDQPNLEITEFNRADIITTSGMGDAGSGGNVDNVGWTGEVHW